MAMNPIQFPPSLSLTELLRQFGTKAKCQRVPYRSARGFPVKGRVTRRVVPDPEGYCDGLACFRLIEEFGHAHAVLKMGGGREAKQTQSPRWANIVFANLKRAISGVYHVLDQHKHARCDLAEAAYRFKRRFRLRALVPQRTRAIMLRKPCPEPSLWLVSDFAHRGLRIDTSQGPESINKKNPEAE